MGLRCLLGHSYGETRTEREREERGDELVVTVTEVEECTRCGETRVVSENTEVTTIDAAPDGATATATGNDRNEPAASTEDAASATVDDATHGEQGADDAEIVGTDDQVDTDEPVDTVIDEAEPDLESSTPDTAATADAEAAADSVDHEAADDAEILDADGDDERGATERGPGEWPDADATHPADASQDVDPGRADDDAEIVDDDPTEDGAAAEARRDVVEADERGRPAEGSDDDAEIVGGDGPVDADAARDAGGIADAGSSTDDVASRWPDHGGEDDGFDAETTGDGNLTPEIDPETVADEDVEFIESTPEPSTPDTNGSGPASAGGESSADAGAIPSDVAERIEREAGSGDDAGANPSGPSNPRFDLPPEDPAVDSEYFCPDCGHSEPVGSSSMRKGDICPECMRGYIDERAVE